MLKYTDTAIVFREIPDEITLAINISGCPCNCIGCHSPYLAENIGEWLDGYKLDTLIEKNKGITCVCFMGGDAEPECIDALTDYMKRVYSDIKVAWYSGKQELAKEIDLKNLDYLKLGPYIKEKGPLTEPTTNQIFYRVVQTEVPSTVLVDETYRFWKKNENSSL